MANPSQNAMFVPHVFRPFWQPNSSGSFQLCQDIAQLEKITKKLDLAERKLDEYARLIASLSAELRRNQDLICDTCREHIVRANLTTAPPPTPMNLTPSASQLSHPSTIYSFVPTSATLDPPCTTPGALAEPIATLSVVHDRTNHLPHAHLSVPCVNNLGSSITAIPSSHLSTSRTPTNLSQPAVPVVSETVTDTCPCPNHSDWSVEYNPKINRRLSLSVTKTFTYTTRVLSVKFSRDGKYLAIGLKSGEVHVHDMMTGTKSILAERPATVFYTDAAEAPSRIRDITFSLDNKCIATGGSQGRINIWEIGRRRICATFKHRKLVRSLDFSSDGRFLVSASCDNSAVMWNIRDGSKISLSQGSFDFTSAAFSPEGHYVAAGNDDGFLRIWDVRTGRLVSRCNIGHRDEIDSSSVIFTPDGKIITSGNNTLKCWNFSSLTSSHAERPRIKDNVTTQLNQIWEFNWCTESITSISLSPDTRWIVSSSLDDRDNVCILDARSGDLVCTLKAHTSRVRGADFSPAGHYIASGGEDRQVKLWRYEMVT